MNAYFLNNSNLKQKKVPYPDKMKSHDLYLKNNFININRFDSLVSLSLLKINHFKDNFIPGSVCGSSIIKSGSAVDKKFNLKNQHVYNIIPQYGAYCENRVIDSKHCILIDSNLNPKIISACILHAFEAYVMTEILYKISDKDYVVINNINDGTNHLMAQIIRQKGAKVIGILNNINLNLNNVNYIKKYLCADILFHNDPNLENKILSITNQKKVDVVYDNLGDIFLKLNKVSKELANYIIYDNALFEISNFNMSIISYKSISYKCFKYSVYANDLNFVNHAVNSVFKLISDDLIKPIINFYNFSDIPYIQRMILSNLSVGCNLVVL